MNCGGDVYMLCSKGHHDFNKFIDVMKTHYPHFLPMTKPKHVWMKNIPPRDGYSYEFREVNKGTRGAWPATFSQETWLGDPERVGKDEKADT